MAPTQRHRWLTLPDSRAKKRASRLVDFVVDRARADFVARYPNLRFGPVVGLIAAYNEADNIGDVLKAMPTMAGAFAYDLYKNLDTIDLGAGLVISLGFVVAFLSALIVVRGFLDFVSRHGFTLFAWWRIVVGAIGLAVAIVFGATLG